MLESEKQSQVQIGQGKQKLHVGKAEDWKYKVPRRGFISPLDKIVPCRQYIFSNSDATSCLATVSVLVGIAISYSGWGPSNSSPHQMCMIRSISMRAKENSVDEDMS